MPRRNVSWLRNLAVACGLALATPLAARADVLWYNTSTQELDYWLTANNFASGTSEYGGGVIAAAGYLNGWVPVGSADLTGDGKYDILLQNQNSGGAGVGYWTMDGVSAVGSTSLSTADTSAYRVVSLVSLRGGSTPDILWQNKTTGDLVYWYLTVSGGAASYASAGAVSYTHTTPGPLASYRAIGAVKFADGTVQVFLQNTSTLQLIYWVLTYTGGVPTLTSSGNVSYPATSLTNYQADALDNYGYRILWQYTPTNDLYYWNLTNSSGVPTYVTGAQFSYPASTLTNYRAIAATTFFNVTSVTASYSPASSSVAGTVTINGVAPPSGVVVYLSLPSSVTIPSGQSSVTYSAPLTGSTGLYTLRATCGDRTATTTFTITR